MLPVQYIRGTDIVTNRQRRQKKVNEAYGGGLRPVRKAGVEKSYWSKKREERIAKGFCARCSAPPVAGSLCRDCWFKNVASNHFGKTSFAPALMILWERQGGCCAYTGATLAPGINASLDHTTPLSKDGVLTVDNVRWVLDVVNRMKTDLTHEQFLAMCRQILDHTSATSVRLAG